MSRVVLLVVVLLGVVCGAVLTAPVPPATAVQPRPDTAGHPLIDSWLLYETNPPAGGPPVLAGVATFFAEGSVVMIFGDQPMQGSWIPTGPWTATVTAVAPSAGGFSELNRLRASVEVATDGGPMRGTYSIDLVRADGSTAFTYRGPIEGRRVEVLPPDPYP
jgi:hypothetical protein